MCLWAGPGCVLGPYQAGGGTVGVYVGGRLMSRQPLVNGAASVILTIVTTTDRPTFRADYSGSDSCATSRDTVRMRVR